MTVDTVESNGTHLIFTGIQGWDSPSLLVGQGGDIYVESLNQTTITMKNHNLTYSKFNLSGSGNVNVTVKKQANTDFDLYVDGAHYNTYTANSSGFLTFSYTLSEHEFILTEVTAVPPTITSYSPSTPVSDTEGASRTFNITVDQTVNVSWYINGTLVQTDTSVTTSSYTNTSASLGYWNVTAIATNDNGTDSQTWFWEVTPNIPVVNSITVPSTMYPSFNNTITVNVTDQDGLYDLIWINCTVYRNSTTHSSPNDAREHYQFAYNVTNDVLYSYPSNYFTLVKSINTVSTTDTLQVNFTPEKYALPSKDTSNSTVNSYVWFVNCSARDLTGASCLQGYSEMSPVISLVVSSTDLSVSVTQKGRYYLFEPNITISNGGNLELDINLSMTNLTYGSYYIGADNCTIDDDPNLEEVAETNLTKLIYHNYVQTWDANLTIMADPEYYINVYNWIFVPFVPDGTYTGTVTYSGVVSYVY
jgi:hypothetical protein